MTLKMLVSACIAIGMHSSLCTGGFFAITAAIAHEAAYSATEDGPMSYGAIGYLSCKSTKKGEEVGKNAEPGCSDAKECISRVSATMKAKAVAVLSPLLHIPAVLETALNLPEYVYNPASFARAGPLYESAPQIAHSLIKLE